MQNLPEPANVPPARYEPAPWERIIAAVCAVLTVLTVLFVIVYSITAEREIGPQPMLLLRIMISFALGVLSSTITGFLNIDLSFKGVAIRAAAGFAVFVLTFLFNPPSGIQQTLLPRRPPPIVTMRVIGGGDYLHAKGERLDASPRDIQLRDMITNITPMAEPGMTVDRQRVLAFELSPKEQFREEYTSLDLELAADEIAKDGVVEAVRARLLRDGGSEVPLDVRRGELHDGRNGITLALPNVLPGDDIIMVVRRKEGSEPKFPDDGGIVSLRTVTRPQ